MGNNEKSLLKKEKNKESNMFKRQITELEPANIVGRKPERKTARAGGFPSNLGAAARQKEPGAPPSRLH